MTPAAYREQVRQAYPGKKWWDRVAAMTDNQIIAVYLRLKSRGKVI